MPETTSLGELSRSFGIHSCHGPISSRQRVKFTICARRRARLAIVYKLIFKEDAILSQNQPILAAGRRKSSVAQVQLLPGVGHVTINGKKADDYLQRDALSLNLIERPLKTVSLEEKYDLVIKVQGGGLKGQAQAIQLGIARALSTYQGSYRPSLKEKGFLSRDSRVKERRKYGLKKARKASQFSKR